MNKTDFLDRCAIDMAIEALKEPKQGEWIYHKEWELDGECAFECSKCGMGTDVDYNFCPNCRADMRRPEANDRQCEKCKHKVETKPGVEACDVWDCSFEPKDEQS